MHKCLRVTLIKDETFSTDELESQIDALIVEGRYLTETTDQPLTVVVYAKQYAFSNCVVWIGVLLDAWKTRNRIGEFTLEALNCEFHNEVVLKNYKVVIPDDAFLDNASSCTIC